MVATESKCKPQVIARDHAVFTSLTNHPQAVRGRTRRRPLAAARRPEAFSSHEAPIDTLFGPASSDEYTSTPDPFHFFSGLLVDYKPENASNWIMDVELMHHYTASAYKTLTSSLEVQDALQHDLPREGLRHPFLMHQILAFAGFHLAYTQPERRHIYLKQASQHQNFTIHGMRKTLAGVISSENCHAAYATSIFICLGAFAVYPCYENYNTFFSPIDSLVEIFNLISGMGLILSTSDEELRTGPLKRLFNKHIERKGPEHPCPELSGRLPLLEAQLDEASAELDEDVKRCIKEATELLQHCIDRVAAEHSGLGYSALRAAFLWPKLLPSAQCHWIKCRHPAAMVILAHYAMLLHSAETDSWYLRGWGRAIAESVAEALAGTSWLNLARWPISVIRGG